MSLKTKTIRYTASLPYEFVYELKELMKEKAIPSVNYAINEALNEYLKSLRTARYAALMKEAAHDDAFLSRTLACANDFSAVDSEVSGVW